MGEDPSGYVCMYCMCAVNLVNFLVRMHSGQEVFLGSCGIHVPVVVILQLQVVVSIQHLMFMQIHMFVCIFVLCFLHVYMYVCMYECMYERRYVCLDI